MEHMKMLFMFIGGLGMFLYGMNVMADGLQKSAGNRMRKLLQRRCYPCDGRCPQACRRA